MAILNLSFHGRKRFRCPFNSVWCNVSLTLSKAKPTLSQKSQKVERKGKGASVLRTVVSSSLFLLKERDATKVHCS